MTMNIAVFVSTVRFTRTIQSDTYDLNRVWTDIHVCGCVGAGIL